MTISVVTGAAGFVGQHLVEALAKRGDEVVATDLRKPAATNGQTPGREVGRGGGAPSCHWLEGDLRDEAMLRRAFRGADVVFHNASVVHTKQSRVHDVWSVNLDGSRAVLRACQAEGVRRLVYVSTGSAVYEGRDIHHGDETLPYSRVSQVPYSDSKIAAEKMLLAANGHRGVATCALRPHVIFGPGDTRFLPAIIKRSKAGKLKFSVGWGTWLSDFTYVSNLVDALLAADQHLVPPGSPVAGQAFFITNGEPRAFFDFVREVLRQLELPPIRGAVPYPVAWLAAAIAEGVDTLRGGTLGVGDGMTRFAVRYMCTHHYFSIEKAHRMLGYQPAVTLDEGIRRSVAALRAAR
jgi:sterol-4alpha-carboxylate 3-dehydrogenase (decarboxylating)